MAKSDAVWGIDIGQCALKALKCRPHEKEDGLVVVESFDYIEYPKILSQPEANPEEIVREALEQFLSRNELGTDSVAMSVSGQSGLARFIKLPPVESKKIPDIVKYEARQQIPFSLEDVVWDYQQLTGGSEQDEFALEPEVGLFAMKRDQVARSLEPLEEVGIEVDFIQLAPLAVYNYVCFDRIGDMADREYDPNDPPESTVVISLGTDTTDLVVTNGFRVWQRNIPIGGSHFTRALSKELKLTFVKAEHLKRNAMQADDPKTVFQAMRPVFSDLLAEIQRSLGYFTSIDKSAKIGDVIALGNAMKLPGLQKYLTQNLEQDVKPIKEFSNLSAGSASGQKQFKENILSFAVSYGLCLQAMDKSELKTNLLPEEIVRSRLIRSKKPWAVAGAAAILLGLTFNYFSHVSAWSATQDPEMTKAESQAKTVSQTSSGFKTRNDDIKTFHETVKTTGENLVSNDEGRKQWLGLIKAVANALPRDERPPEEREETAEDISNRHELHIVSFDSQKFTDLQSEWYQLVEKEYLKSIGKQTSLDGGGDSGYDDYSAEPAANSADPEGESTVDLAKPGWVIQLTGFHYHNADRKNQTRKFVENTLIKSLKEEGFELPKNEGDQLVQVSYADFGISHPWIFDESRLRDEIIDPEVGALDAGNRRNNRMTEGRSFFEEGGFSRGDEAEEEESKLIELKRYDFVVQFCWIPTTEKQREQIAEQRRLAEEARAAAAAAEAENADAAL